MAKDKNISGDLFNPVQLLESIFTKLKELETISDAGKLFPNGIESVDLNVIESVNSNEFRLRMTAKSNKADGDTLVNIVSDQTDDELTISFDAEGHKIISLIAKMDLEQNNPAIRDKLKAILDAADRTWEEAAVFPDEIRNSHPETKPFHFVDIPFQDGGPINPPLPHAPHVLTKMEEFTQALKQGAINDAEKADAISWIFHLFGDVHQPLHCIEHISELHPGGDRGGNSFKLKGSAKNLHSAWDSSVNVLEHGKGNEELAVEIMQLHTRQTLANDLGEVNPEKWARSSYNLAKTNAYSIEENPANPPKLSTAYINNMQKIGRRQAALAGYRLANRLVEIFQS